MHLDQEKVGAVALFETSEADTSLESGSIASAEVRKWVFGLDAAADPSERIRLCLECMQAMITSTAPPKFREFWEVRRFCLPLFKESSSLKRRGDLWRQYVDLSIEARRLKGILDEQSAFASEQIDLAIEALIGDLDSYQERMSQMFNLDVMLAFSPFDERKEKYNEMQKELNLLNAFAAKINSLRKESIKTDMRVRSKNKIFEKLSECGDRVFPLRKELIKKISEEFSEDIRVFVKTHFEGAKKPSHSLHLLREEVKSLQLFAKLLTLNTQSFNDSRIALSFCWDLLKTWDKEKKKEILEQRALQKKNYEEGFAKVKEFEAFCLGETSISLVLSKYQETLESLKALPELSSQEFRGFRESLQDLKRPFEEKEREKKLFFQRQERDQEEIRGKKIQEFREKLQTLMERMNQESLEELIPIKEALEEEFKGIQTTKGEKVLLDRLLRQMKDSFLEIKGKNLLSLSHSDLEKYEELKAIVQEKKERRQEIKVQLEGYRKFLGGSGFDFEKAMMYRELIESEKEILEKMNAAIEELESKMSQIEG